MRNWIECPNKCSQIENCLILRKIFKFAEYVTKRLGNYEHLQFGSIFRGMKMQLIGSMKEGTKIFILDEFDIHLSLSKSSNKTTFNPKTQTLYVDGKVFPCEDYVRFYFKCLRKILSDSASFSKLPMKISYSPCVKCMQIKDGDLQPYRCHHNPGCLIHLEHRCKDMEEECPFECECQSFVTPSIGWSKIGAVLHFGMY